MSSYQTDPNALMELVRSSPQLMNLVDMTAKAGQLQQAVQQVAPTNSFMQGSQWGNQAPTAQPVQAQQPQQQQAPTNMLDMAMGIVTEFRNYFSAMNNNLKEIYDQNEAIHEFMDEFKKGIQNQKPTFKGKGGKADAVSTPGDTGDETNAD